MGPLAAPVVCQARIGSRHCFKIRPRPLISGTADAFASSMIASIHIAASSGSPQVPERRRSIRGNAEGAGADSTNDGFRLVPRRHRRTRRTRRRVRRPLPDEHRPRPTRTGKPTVSTESTIHFDFDGGSKTSYQNQKAQCTSALATPASTNAFRRIRNSGTKDTSSATTVSLLHRRLGVRRQLVVTCRRFDDRALSVNGRSAPEVDCVHERRDRGRPHRNCRCGCSSIDPRHPSDTTLASVASESVASTTVAPTTTTTVPPAPCDRRVVNGADQGNLCRGSSPAVRSRTASLRLSSLVRPCRRRSTYPTRVRRSSGADSRPMRQSHADSRASATISGLLSLITY